MKYGKPDYTTYKRIHREIEKIIRAEGDQHLNIFGFIKKMYLEMTQGNLSIEKCAETNEIPARFLEVLQKIPMEYLEKYQEKLKREISSVKNKHKEKNVKQIQTDINPVLKQIIFKSDDFKAFLTTGRFLFTPYEKKPIKSMLWKEFENRVKNNKKALETFIKTTDKINGTKFFLKAKITPADNLHTILLNNFRKICETISEKEGFPETRVLFANGLDLRKGAYLSFGPGEYKFVRETNSIVPMDKKTEYMLKGETIIKDILKKIYEESLSLSELKQWKIIISRGKKGIATIEPSDYVWAVKPSIMKLRKADMNGLPLGFRLKERMPEQTLKLIFVEKEKSEKKRREKPSRDFGPGM